MESKCYAQTMQNAINMYSNDESVCFLDLLYMTSDQMNSSTFSNIIAYDSLNQYQACWYLVLIPNMRIKCNSWVTCFVTIL